MVTRSWNLRRGTSGLQSVGVKGGICFKTGSFHYFKCLNKKVKFIIHMVWIKYWKTWFIHLASLCSYKKLFIMVIALAENYKGVCLVKKILAILPKSAITLESPQNLILHWIHFKKLNKNRWKYNFWTSCKYDPIQETRVLIILRLVYNV